MKRRYYIILGLSLFAFIITYSFLTIFNTDGHGINGSAFNVFIECGFGFLFILGYYLFMSDKSKIDFKYLPIYGLSAIIDAVGYIKSMPYNYILRDVSFIVFLTAFILDFYNKKGLYLIIKGRY